ncbi:MAG: ATP-binding protein [Verrucomicrobiales bacterium]|nr:ATP-binding protein [Verrucomicrobiales bacterium]
MHYTELNKTLRPACPLFRGKTNLLEIIDDRIGRGATLLTSQYPVGQWHDTIGDATVADALLDRLVHNAYRIELDGKSLRDPKSAPAD